MSSDPNTPPRVQEWHFHWRFWSPLALDDATIRFGWWAHVAGFVLEYLDASDNEYTKWEATRLTAAGVVAKQAAGEIQ